MALETLQSHWQQVQCSRYCGYCDCVCTCAMWCMGWCSHVCMVMCESGNEDMYSGLGQFIRNTHAGFSQQYFQVRQHWWVLATIAHTQYFGWSFCVCACTRRLALLALRKTYGHVTGNAWLPAAMEVTSNRTSYVDSWPPKLQLYMNYLRVHTRHTKGRSVLLREVVQENSGAMW